ncbi:protein Wnt-8b-like isoform X2 [Panulirus ornatus]|uniref:protein Wnt-8b-like isoform X2 n=1 Tax=Panulirus ornatus TaxID=150431 RepID=UPI003A85A5F8
MLLMEGVSLTESITRGAQLGLQECQTQFTWERWSCPNTTTTWSGEAVTREAAFVRGITAAGVTFTITKDCSQGRIPGCPCSGHRGNTGFAWKWRGCSHNVEFGSTMTRQVLDGWHDGQDARALVNLQNNQAGRVGVKRCMRRACRCHGVSGSCTTQTCWFQLGAFAVVGRALKKRYRRATKLEDTNALSADANLVVYPPADLPSYVQRLEDHPSTDVVTMIPGVEPDHLVYLVDSPDHCRANQTAGVVGTEGRACSRARGPGVAREERASCRKLCRQCGLHVNRRIHFVTHSCQCQFRWCCQVECATCNNTVATYTCASGDSL